MVFSSSVLRQEQQKIAAWLQAQGVVLPVERFSACPSPDLGDMAIPCFGLNLDGERAPGVIATRLAEILQASGLVASAEAAGPYINVRFTDASLGSMLHAVLEVGEGYGAQPPASAEAKEEHPVVFEYANPNTHKEIHIGHLRNFVTGVAYHSLWKAAGVPVQAVQFVNDQGVNVAKTLWRLVESHGYAVSTLSREQVDTLLASVPIEERTGNMLARVYVEAGQLLEECPEAVAEISRIQAALEAGDVIWTTLWRETRDWCLRELGEICAELGVQFDKPTPYLESDLLQEAKEIVDGLEQSGVAQISEGALVIALEEQKLGTALIRKTDGNLLYLSKDLALAKQKLADYPRMRQSIVLVDNRQSFHCKQLQAVLQKLPAESFPHAYGYADYGLLTLKEGAMSSRKGNVVTYQELRDSVVAYAVEQTRARHADWDEETVQRTAHAIALGGMKFALLKQDPNTIFTFDREQALAFEGVTGPYCQYAVVRLQGILSRAQGLAYQNAPLAMDDAWTPAERELLLAVSRLTDIVVTASGVQLDGIIDPTKTNPSVLAQWCFSTAQLVNAFYRDVPVMDAEGDVRLRRLALAFAARRALMNGLSFLTIDVPERM